MKNRFKELRKAIGFTQEELAEKIGLSRSYINLIEMGKKIPAERTIKDICRTFNINEKWLFEGEGEMFLPELDEEAVFVSQLLSDDDNPLYDLIKDVMKAYCELGPKEQEVLKMFALKLKDKQKKESQD